jgi:hypothetical protein
MTDLPTPGPIPGSAIGEPGITVAERVEYLRKLGHINEYGAQQLLAFLSPSGRRKYLYRVTATWDDYNRLGPRSEVRHFQSKQSADKHAAKRLEGLEEIAGGPDPSDDGAPGVPPATTVTVERSLPVAWPEASA